MQNGVAERINMTNQERVTDMRPQAGLKLEFWAEALHMTIYMINLSLSKAIWIHVPQALWSRTQSTYNRRHIFGCEAYAFIPNEKWTELAPHSMKCIFSQIWDEWEFGYGLWDLENRQLMWSSGVVFNEDSNILSETKLHTGKRVSLTIFRRRLKLTHRIPNLNRLAVPQPNPNQQKVQRLKLNWLKNWPGPNRLP